MAEKQTIRVRMTGMAPGMLMHSDRFSDPTNPMTIRHKELTSKRKRTLDDHLNISKSEWLGGLYLDGDKKIVMPTQNIKATIVEGGKANKMGTTIARAMFCFDEYVPLEYDGPADPEKLYDHAGGVFVDKRSVVVQRARLIRCRPKFPAWSCEATFVYMESMLQRNQIEQALDVAGELVGIGDYRPACKGPFGRFTWEIID